VGAALTQSNGTFRPKTDVVLSAPDLDWSYAVIERLSPATLKTSLVAFNPRLLYQQSDSSQNLALEPGDIVTFFSTADISVPTSQQTRLIHLEGEFAAAGVYSVEPGETLRHLLTRVGGFTPDAYLYGSQFTRESTRRVQQQRLSEYADTLEERVSAFAAASSSRAISDRDAAASAAAAVEARQSIVRLRQTVPVGRIVLELQPDSRSIDSLPDIPLEDGDRFLVPQVPATVEVEGRVYSANAFVFQRDRKERDYLRKAGGPDPDADRKGAFILRADGSVFSKQYGNVSKAKIFPGDTIVVPPQIDRRNLLRGVLDISSIFGQFGLAAAAINVLR
jgi:polysaccharide export outer membrane protein